MKKDRIPELHFYEWRVSAWHASETRDRLDATGRGIYRELLDCCYSQGRFPDDQDWICRRCACSQDELAKTWPIIVKHFPISKRKGYREYQRANIVRREYFAYVSRQKKAREDAIRKARELRDIQKQAPSKPQASPNPAPSKPQPNGNINGNTTATATHTQTTRDACVPDRFDDWIKPWPRCANPDQAARAWISHVTPDCVDAAFACRDRYLASDEVARSVVMEPWKFLMEQSAAGWSGKWPPAPSKVDRREQEMAEVIARVEADNKRRAEWAAAKRGKAS